MAGIYIHIPFCRKACTYCNFHFSTNHQLINQVIDSIGIEMSLQSNYLSDPIETIYFGGGTPSLLNHSQLEYLFNKVRSLFTVLPEAEITLEANPDDINEIQLTSWIKLGINRLSIGVQSFRDKDLLWMGRAHNADQAMNCVSLAQQVGITNISIDLIYGIPGLSDTDWSNNIDYALNSNVPHLSCYALTVEPRTALAHYIINYRTPDIDAGHQANHFQILQEKTAGVGFEQYEISNFSLPGKRSKHNSNYWSGKHYLGIGPSAHSFNGLSRQWNINNNALYIQSLAKGIIPFETETLTLTQQINEYIMTSLRTIEGIQASKINEIAGKSIFDTIIADASHYIKEGLISLQQERLFLSPSGKFMADGIAANLFRDEPSIH
ncbi:radical SAM family heme chaperone HemW [Sediminibacterium sp.]|uniref:radical SAM family heme chaperone HemW n=1 Tax=Sediminibacterium sp. TaxID=1917865 RepID=UPI003F723C96